MASRFTGRNTGIYRLNNHSEKEHLNNTYVRLINDKTDKNYATYILGGQDEDVPSPL